jgi:hypothetical protein
MFGIGTGECDLTSEAVVRWLEQFHILSDLEAARYFKN